jgi:hypothetical protein
MLAVMKRFPWARTVSLLALGSLSSWACGDASDDGAPGGAGNRGEAGAGGQSNDVGAGGDGGADACAADPESEDCREVPWCGPFGIQEVCGPTPFPLCPANLAELVERTACDSVSMLERYDTTCGQVLVRYYDERTEFWQFDEDDALLGVFIEASTLHRCFEGGRSFSWLYGAELCDIDVASKVDVCMSEGGAGAGGAGSGGAAAGGAGGVEPSIGGAGAGGAETASGGAGGAG